MKRLLMTSWLMGVFFTSTSVLGQLSTAPLDSFVQKYKEALVVFQEVARQEQADAVVTRLTFNIPSHLLRTIPGKPDTGLWASYQTSFESDFSSIVVTYTMWKTWVTKKEEVPAPPSPLSFKRTARLDGDGQEATIAVPYRLPSEGGVYLGNIPDVHIMLDAISKSLPVMEADIRRLRGLPPLPEKKLKKRKGTDI